MATAEQSTKASEAPEWPPGSQAGSCAPWPPRSPGPPRAPAAHICSYRADTEQLSTFYNQDDVHNLDFRLLLRNQRIWDAPGGLSGGASASAQGVIPGDPRIQGEVPYQVPSGEPASPSLPLMNK